MHCPPLRPERKTICGRRWSAAEVDRLSEDRGEMMMRSSSQEREIGRTVCEREGEVSAQIAVVRRSGMFLLRLKEAVYSSA